MVADPEAEKFMERGNAIAEAKRGHQEHEEAEAMRRGDKALAVTTEIMEEEAERQSGETGFRATEGRLRPQFREAWEWSGPGGE